MLAELPFFLVVGPDLMSSERRSPVLDPFKNQVVRDCLLFLSSSQLSHGFLVGVALSKDDLGRGHIDPFRGLSYTFFDAQQCSENWVGCVASCPVRWCLLVAYRWNHQMPWPRHIVHADPSPLMSCMDSEAMLSARGGKAEYCPCPEIPATCPLPALRCP